MTRSFADPRHVAGAALAAIALSGSANAGALEQVVPDTIRLLYTKGSHLEFGGVYAEPRQSGAGVVAPGVGPLPGNTGDIFDPAAHFSGAFKADINDRLSYLIGFDQPFAGHTTFGTGSYPVPIYDGTFADVDTLQITAALAYDLTTNVKIFGGARALRYDTSTAVTAYNYSADTEATWEYGYLVGAGYERPEIALRVALTYYSNITYDLPTTESVLMPGATVATFANTTTRLETPESVQLDFQTGVAPKTQVFGFIRWANWSEFDVTPPLFGQITTAAFGQPQPLVSYEGDIWTYNLGIGRQLTDRLAGAFSITYEQKTGDTMPTLAPFDGQLLGTLSLSYDFKPNWNISGGITFGKLGDARNDLGTNFNDGSVWGAGMRVSYTF